MHRYSPDDVGQAIAGVRAHLGLSPQTALQEEFDSGFHPNLLAYGKVQDSANSLLMIEKYLIGATSFLHQPSNYYDIFRACRCVKLVQVIDKAITLLTNQKIPELETRLKRLMVAHDHDSFEAVIFELATAARYVQHPQVKNVRFIREAPPNKTADFSYQHNGCDAFVECKKINRMQEHSVDVRNIVRDRLNGVISIFRKEGISVLLDITFHRDPEKVSESLLIDCSRDAFRFRTAIVNSDFTIVAQPLPAFSSDQLHLFPSPTFMWNRYGYRVRSEWFGVINQYLGTPGRVRATFPGGTSSWISSIDWDAAAKWKISSEAVVAKYRRFAFDGVFKALQQIASGGPNSTVHIWLESEYFVGPRKQTFDDLLARVSRNMKLAFGWLIINETLFDVSPKGFFDMIEHAHFVRGKTGIGTEPLVDGIFTPPTSGGIGKSFGEGAELPDIDEI